MPKRPHAALLTLAAAMAVPAAARAASCADVLLSNCDLSRFAALTQASGLAPQVARGQMTVFAPTNAALDCTAGVTQMSTPQNSSGSPDFPKLQTLVRAHLVSGLHPEHGMHATLDPAHPGRRDHRRGRHRLERFPVGCEQPTRSSSLF